MKLSAELNSYVFLNSGQGMILPDFAQAFIEKEIQLNPIPAVIYPP